jgi:hypothetical protein
MSGGGGSSGTQQSTSYTTNVPGYAKEPFMEMIGKGVALSEAPYQAYGGERVSQFTPLQRQAFGQAETQSVAGQLGQASGIAGLAAQQGLQAGQFQPGTFTPMAAQAPQLQQFQLGAPIGVGTQSFTQPGAAEQFMSPYMQNVVDNQKREAQRAADIAGTQRGAQAVRAGAFGGSRQAIMDAEAQRNLAQQMGDIQATGSQAAFQQAQDLFGREQQMGLQAQMANQQAGLTAGQANLQSMLQTQGLGAGQSLQAQLANQQAMMDAQRAFEQSRQFGSELRLRGGAQALQGAQTLGQLGQQQFGQEMDIMGARQQMGTTQQQQIQRILDQQFADFQTQRDFPYQQLGFLSDLLRGTGSSTRTVNQVPQPSAIQQMAGLGTAAAGFSGMMAKGGEVRYADGGITGLLGDQQLAQTAQNPAQGPMMQLAAAEEAQQRDMIRSAVPADMPLETDMTEQELLAAMQQAIREGNQTKARVIAEIIEERKMPESGIAAIASDDIGDMPEGGLVGMADGGAVAFKGGGLADLGTAYDRAKSEHQRSLDSLRRFGGRQKLADPQGYQSALTATQQAESELEAAKQEWTSASQGMANLGQSVNPALIAAQDVEAPAALATPAAPDGIAALAPEAAQAQRATDSMRNRSREAQSRASEARREEQALAEAGGNVSTADGAPGAPGGAVTPESYMRMLQEAGYDPQKVRQDLMMRQEQVQRDRAEGVAADRASLDEMIAARGVYSKEQEDRLKGELEGITGRKETAKSMALFQAGLAILSADPSRGALAAIGEGALKGVGAYKGDLEKLESQREKINERTDRILDIRRQESMADDKERLALKKEENRLKQLNSQEVFEMNKGFDVEDRTLGTAVTDQVIRSREKALDRQDRAQRLSQAGKGDAAQYRMMLTSEIIALRDKRDKGVGLDEAEARELANYEAELKSLGSVLSGRIGIEGSGGSGGANQPKIGAVQEGYRFKGGNPADQSNWEKVK